MEAGRRAIRLWLSARVELVLNHYVVEALLSSCGTRLTTPKVAIMRRVVGYRTPKVRKTVQYSCHHTQEVQGEPRVHERSDSTSV